MAVMGLIYNLSVLVALSVLSGFVEAKFKRTELAGKIIQGLLFGAVTIFGMLFPFTFADEVIFDGRSIIISLCALFFGQVPALIASSIAAVCRIYIAGSGVIPGLILIVSSLIIGLYFHKKYSKTHYKNLTALKLYFFGILIHLALIIIVSIVPEKSFLQNFEKIVITILGIYPIITLVTGKVLLDQQRNAQYFTEISEREELFRTTLYSIGDAVITTDTEGKIQQLNPVAERITGWKEIEAKGRALKEVFKIVNEITGEKVESPVDIVLKEGKIVGLANHTILISKNGEEIPIADSGAPIHDRDGNITGVVLVFRDQTNERASQKALSESEEIFRQFMKYSPIYVFFKDKDIRSIRLSKNYEKLLGRPIEELLGKNMFELFPSDFAAKMVEDDKKILNEGKIIEVLEEFNGRIYNTIKFPIHHDGKPVFLAGFTIDITESKKAEEALQNSERNLREIYNSTNEAIFLHEANKGKVIDVNETMIRMFGYDSKEEVLNASFEELNANIDQYDFKTAIDYLTKALTDGPQVFEWLGKKKNGDFIWLEVSLKSSSIGGGGKILAVARDITERKKTEENLREVTELQKAILENASYAIISTNAEGVIRSFNPAAEKITGYSAAEVINKYTPEIFHDPAEIFERAKLFSQELGETVHPGFHVFVIKAIHKLPTEYEWTYIRKDETRIPVFLSVSALYDSAGNITGFLGIANDISERKHQQRLLELRSLELKESEEKYRTLFEQSKDAMLIIDKNIFVDCNDAALKMLRFKSKDELLNTHPSVLSPEVQPDGRLSYEKAEEMMSIAKEMGSHRFEWVHRKADGEDFFVEVSLTIIPYQKRQIIHTSWRDITDRKKAEEKILTLSKGIEQSPAMVIISDRIGNIEYVNPKFTEVTGYTFEEVYGRNLRLLKSGYHDNAIYKDLWETITKGKMWKGELLNKKKNGELFWEHVSISPIRNEKRDITNFIAVKEDITERKKMMEDLIQAKEKAEKTNQLKSEFLAQMSHEIRSPINTMVSFTSLIEEELRDKKNQELEMCFNGIESASKRVIRTIDLILNMSELQLGTYETSKRKINLSNELSNLKIEYMKIASAKNLELNLKIESENTFLHTDEYAVNQIFANLIDNAIKYTEKGKVEIILKEEGNGHFIVKISDTGIGISNEYIDKLFEPFSQEEQGYTRRFEGNGLGMALVKKYCDLIDAEISVKSEKNIGTTFTVILPKE